MKKIHFSIFLFSIFASSGFASVYSPSIQQTIEALSVLPEKMAELRQKIEKRVFMDNTRKEQLAALLPKNSTIWDYCLLIPRLFIAPIYIIHSVFSKDPMAPESTWYKILISLEIYIQMIFELFNRITTRT